MNRDPPAQKRTALMRIKDDAARGLSLLLAGKRDKRGEPGA